MDMPPPVCLPPRWSQTRASSWGETWNRTSVADFVEMRVHLTLPKSWFKPAFCGCFCGSPWRHHDLTSKTMWRWFAPLCQRWAEGKEGITFLEMLWFLRARQLHGLCGALTKTLLSSLVMEALIHCGRLWVPHMCRQEPCWNKSRTLNLYSLIPSVNLLQRIRNNLFNGLFKCTGKTSLSE